MASQIKRYAIINVDTNIVENIVMWDGNPRWSPPEGCVAELVGDAYVGTGMVKVQNRFEHREQLPAKKSLKEFIREQYTAIEGVEPDEE